MTCLTREMAFDAIKDMQKFHTELDSTFQKFGMDFKENLGRRNIVMSHAQEKFFTDALRSKYKNVINDGRTGQPDIVIHDESDFQKEIECKLTTRHRSGAISFQSDYETLLKKENLDYLYVLASDDFRSFGIFYFENLTVDDFRPLSTGARGKVAMYKHKGFKKCTVLAGGYKSVNQRNIKKLNKILEDTTIAPYKKRKAEKSLKYWNTTPEKFEIHLEHIE